MTLDRLALPAIAYPSWTSGTGSSGCGNDAGEVVDVGSHLAIEDPAKPWTGARLSGR